MKVKIGDYMDKDIQLIVKNAAERYGLEYNEEQKESKVKNKDGTVRKVKKSDMKSIIDVKNIIK
ncbi:hypothetical protein NST17_19550 [Caldifermentibacillus hisashii]|uniref:Uncharacterized protein n=1 Tax=Caldifermentibacillus hisashii TaxID=996558 RepID=A0ABU9K2I7_9BACI